MNTYKRFCPNVFIAQCEDKHEKGDVVVVETRYGKENEHIVHNLVRTTTDYYQYSITRVDGFNSQERAKSKIEKLEGYADNADKRSAEWREKSNEGKDFLSLGEPIKIGHHSEKSHRNLIERNWNRFSNAMDESKKAESYRDRTAYWEKLSEKINLSMPESLEFFEVQLKEATEYHKDMKAGKVKRDHSYSLRYAKKRCNDLKKKLAIAKVLWA